MSATELQSAESTSTRAGLGPRFTAQLASTGLANLGDGILQTMAPLVALTLTTSPVAISLLSAVGWLPSLLLSIAAGVIVDRVDRRHVQVVSLVARAGVLLAAAALVAAGQLSMPLLLALVVAYGVTEVFADLGASSILPALVSTDQLATANGRVMGVQQVANSFVGAPVAGFLLVLGAGWGFGTSAALAALAAAVLWVGLRGSYRPARTNQDQAGSAMAEVKDGLRFVFRHRVIRPLVLAASLLNFAFTGYFAVFVLWVVGPGSAMGLSQAQYPLLTLGFAVGAVAGSLCTEVAQRIIGEVPLLVGSLTLSAALLVVPALWPNVWVTAGTLVLIGFVNALGNVVAQSLRQRLVPSELLGRVGGASRTLAFGLMPLGALLAGLVAELVGLVATFLTTAGFALLVCGYLAVALRTAELPGQESVADRDQ
ncbi:putative MFS family arabinose efflux permease [Propionicimonas paludicola]|uniref:Putative MFS family arabinose efflux permease n=1 Tax=Propionicimonas paludicola TaxID=185243 RepID=A0A2A9CUK7_9ACTN|nr:MFS transporter [Propionicimonas paludicola]PFG17300.1 putative MFS family arabinose efflux permease [Propionicimonas paludicola]